MLLIRIEMCIGDLYRAGKFVVDLHRVDLLLICTGWFLPGENFSRPPDKHQLILRISQLAATLEASETQVHCLRILVYLVIYDSG